MPKFQALIPVVLLASFVAIPTSHASAAPAKQPPAGAQYNDPIASPAIKRLDFAYGIDFSETAAAFEGKMRRAEFRRIQSDAFTAGRIYEATSGDDPSYLLAYFSPKSQQLWYVIQRTVPKQRDTNGSGTKAIYERQIRALESTFGPPRRKDATLTHWVLKEGIVHLKLSNGGTELHFAADDAVLAAAPELGITAPTQAATPKQGYYDDEDDEEAGGYTGPTTLFDLLTYGAGLADASGDELTRRHLKSKAWAEASRLMSPAGKAIEDAVMRYRAANLPPVENGRDLFEGVKFGHSIDDVKRKLAGFRVADQDEQRGFVLYRGALQDRELAVMGAFTPKGRHLYELMIVDLTQAQDQEARMARFKSGAERLVKEHGAPSYQNERRMSASWQIPGGTLTCSDQGLLVVRAVSDDYLDTMRLQSGKEAHQLFGDAQSYLREALLRLKD
ncbi:hypothetical protein J7643_08205 [bacterium]|nr:hypothetical protein [bacterium]